MPVIKRYSNRKLYDTDSKRYVTLDDVAEFIRQGEEVRVVDHVSGNDLTSVILLQILFEEQKRIGGLLPGVFLTRLIQAGGETVSSLRSRVASMAPFQLVDEEIHRRVQALIDREQITQDEGQHIRDLLIQKPAQADVVHILVKGEDEPGEQANQEGENVSDDPNSAGVDPAQVEALLNQVEVLERELELLKQRRQA